MIEQSTTIAIAATYIAANESMVPETLERLHNLVDFYDENGGEHIELTSGGTAVIISGTIQVLWPGCYAKIEEHIELSLAMVGEIVGGATRVEACVIPF